MVITNEKRRECVALYQDLICDLCHENKQYPIDVDVLKREEGNIMVIPENISLTTNTNYDVGWNYFYLCKDCREKLEEKNNKTNYFWIIDFLRKALDIKTQWFVRAEYAESELYDKLKETYDKYKEEEAEKIYKEGEESCELLKT